MSARRILLVLGVGFAALFVYALASPERIATALLPLRIVLLGGMPLLSVGCLLAARRWRSTAQVNLILTLSSVAIAVFLLELLSPLIRDTGARFRNGGEAATDGRDKLEVVLDLQAAGVDAVPSIEPKGLLGPSSDSTVRSRLSDRGAELQPLGGIANRRTVVCNETGTWVMYDSDRFGMNNPDDVWEQRGFDVAVVGDSFTNGWCADDETHYVSQLRRRYPGTANLGQSGNGPLLILASILEYLVDARPRRVVWFHYEGNDFWDLEAERRSPLLLRYLETGQTQNLAQRQAAIDLGIRSYVRTAIDEWRDLGNLAIGGPDPGVSLASITRVAKLTNFRRFFGLHFTPAFSPDYELLDQVLAAAKRIVDSWGGQLFVVYLPASARYRAIAGSGGPWENDRARVAALVDEMGVPFIDAHEVFVGHGRPLSLYNPIVGGDYGHFTSTGNRLVAGAVLDALANSSH